MKPKEPLSDSLVPHEYELTLLRRLTPAEKLRVAFQLRETAWQLTAAGVRLRQPELDDAAVEDRVREIFLRAANG
ncbi:MAG: hypothetical protein ACREMA_09700 [Longimicrobiales bacterium]